MSSLGFNGSDSSSGVAASSSSSSSSSSSGLSSMLSPFGNGSQVGTDAGSSSNFDVRAFLESNSYVAKFAFILMVFILFMVLLRLGVLLLVWLFSPGSSPTLLDGTVRADDLRTVYQDPNEKDSIPIIRSTNESSGIEFTWSVWVNVSNPPEGDKYSRVFNKGTAISKSTTGADKGIYVPNNAPGIYLKKGSEGTDKVVALAVIMNVANSKGDDYYEKIEVTNVPMERWVNIMVRVTNNIIDVYINGRLAKRHKAVGVPLQNYGNIFIGEQSSADSFTGMISSLKYFNYALGATKIITVVNDGPNKKMLTRGGEDDEGSVKPSSYLSSQWFYNNNRV